MILDFEVKNIQILKYKNIYISAGINSNGHCVMCKVIEKDMLLYIEEISKKYNNITVHSEYEYIINILEKFVEHFYGYCKASCFVVLDEATIQKTHDVHNQAMNIKSLLRKIKSDEEYYRMEIRRQKEDEIRRVRENTRGYIIYPISSSLSGAIDAYIESKNDMQDYY